MRQMMMLLAAMLFVSCSSEKNEVMAQTHGATLVWVILTGWIDCYPKSRLAGTLFCGGVNEAREIEGNSKLQEAFEMGKRV